MTDGVLLRETLKDSDLDKYRYGNIDKFTHCVHALLFVCNKNSYEPSCLTPFQGYCHG